MDLRQLKYFVQIVESGSLSKASRQLFVAQPALSTQMARLEREVGNPLLIRSAKGVAVTPNGEALYHHAKFLIRQFEEAIFVARKEYSRMKGRVTVGLAPSTAAMLGLPLLEHMRENYPGIVLNVVAVHSGYLEDLARTGQLDLTVLFSNTAASELTCEELLQEQLFVMAPKDSSIIPSYKSSLTLRDAATLPLILPGPGYGLRRQVMLEFERANVPYEVVAEIDSLLLTMRYSANGGGVTIQPMASTQALDSPYLWRCLPISDAHMERTNYLYSLPLPKLSAAASIVRSELKSVARKLVESDNWKGVRFIEKDVGENLVWEPPQSVNADTHTES